MDVTSFKWRGKRLDYLDHEYNTTALNERAIEVPIAQEFIARQTGEGLEIGNVLSHYGDTDHRVVDLFEEADHVENLDILDLEASVDWVVAISTLEHVHTDDPTASIRALRRLLDFAPKVLVTVPFDQHPYLDGAILGGAFKPTYQASLLWSPDGWDVVEGEAVWRPRRTPHVWPASLWVAEWRRR